jgi:ketopantoate reductase
MQQHLPQQEIQRTGLSVQAPTSTYNATLKVATVVQQIVTELSEAVMEKYKLIVITKNKKYLIQRNKMAARVLRPLKVVVLNTNGIRRQRYECSKPLQDVALLSEGTSQTP